MTRPEDATILAAGEILYDVFPKYSRLGGAPFNFFFHLAALGWDAHMASRVGRDERGLEILDTFAAWGFSGDTVQTDLTRRTGYVMVSFGDGGEPEYVIVEDVAYDFMEYAPELAQRVGQGVDLFYFGTLIQRSAKSARCVDEILKNLPDGCVRMCDLNLRPHCYDIITVKKCLEHADVLKINLDELGVIKRMFDVQGRRDEAVARLMEQYSIGWVSLTMGGDGSALYTEEGKAAHRDLDEYDVRDTVGAGDAYASVLAMGRLAGWDRKTILERASRFAGAVCGIEGAVPGHRNFYDPFREWTDES